MTLVTLWAKVCQFFPGDFSPILSDVHRQNQTDRQRLKEEPAFSAPTRKGYLFLCTLCAWRSIGGHVNELPAVKTAPQPPVGLIL